MNCCAQSALPSTDTRGRTVSPVDLVKMAARARRGELQRSPGRELATYNIGIMYISDILEA